MRRLDALLTGDDPARPVARRNGRIQALGELREQVRRVTGHVLSVGGADWIVPSGDALDFAVHVLGASLAGARVLVPQNARQAALERILADHPLARVLDEECLRAPPHQGLPGGAERARVVFYTSGTTGEACGHDRPLSALVTEVEALERIFGPEMEGREVVATVPHHFIYGALFRVFWPLLSGRCFDAEPLADLGELATRLALGRCALVSSPSFIERHAHAWPVSSHAGPVVFSSGSALDASSARKVASAGSLLYEVYGSTETGGVAWREGAVDGWTPLPGVSVVIAEDGTLGLRSPHACPGVNSIADRAQLLPGGAFRLAGRVDRVAKVEGRRVSLDALEQLALGHPSVAAAAFFPVQEGGRLAAVIVPRWESPSLDLDKLAEDLRQRILSRHDATIAPRRWRFVPSLPVDERGKRSLPTLRAVSGLDPADPWRALPRILHAGHGLAGGLTLRMTVEPSHPAFAGHFPGHPILPGILLVHWAEGLASGLLGWPGQACSVHNLKFNRPVFPGAVFELTLSSDADGVSFHYGSGGESWASGRLTS